MAVAKEKAKRQEKPKKQSAGNTPKANAAAATTGSVLAVIRIRGIRNMKPGIRHTLELLRLEKPNHCIVIHQSPQMKGMLNVVKDYVTFGAISEETLFRVITSRGELGRKGISEVKNEADVKKIAKEIFAGRKTGEFLSPVFRLRPPRRGYGDIKSAWPRGELGKREEVDSLIRRMI